MLSFAFVTPSFQQAPYLEAAMESVLGQGYPALQYAVMDGGSTDGSVEIIQRHAARLAHWQSAPDDGQYASVAEGFSRLEGDILGWLNSDDLLCPWAFSVVAEIFEKFPQVEWLTTARPLFWDRAGRAVHSEKLGGFSRAAFQQGEHLPQPGSFALGYIQQEATFWRRSLWERAGGFDSRYPLAGDFALWARFYQHAELFAVETPLGGFRTHGDQKTGRAFAAYSAEAERAFQAYGGHRPRIVHRPLREVATRLPSFLWPLLAGVGLLHRAQVIRYDRAAGQWRLEPRFI